MSDFTWPWGQWTWTDVAPDSHLAVPSTTMCHCWFCSFVWSLNSPYCCPTQKGISNLCEDSLKQSHRLIFWFEKTVSASECIQFFWILTSQTMMIIFPWRCSYAWIFSCLLLLTFCSALRGRKLALASSDGSDLGKKVTTLCQDFLPLFSLKSCTPNRTVLCEGVVSSQVVCPRLVAAALLPSLNYHEPSLPYFLLGCFVIPHTGYLGNREVVMLVYERKQKHVRCQPTALLIIMTLMGQCCCQEF